MCTKQMHVSAFNILPALFPDVGLGKWVDFYLHSLLKSTSHELLLQRV